MDISKYVDVMVTAGWDKAEATKRLNALIAKANELMKGESAEAISSVIDMKVKGLLRGGQGDKFKGYAVAISDKRDMNKKSKDNAIASYNKDPVRAIKDKIVELKTVKVKDAKGKEVEKKEVIPLDTRKFYDKDGKKENKNFGKPIPVQMRRSIFWLIGDEFYLSFGDVDHVDHGKEYEFMGTKGDTGIINLSKVPAPRPLGSPDALALWKAVYAAASKSKLGLGIGDIGTAEPRTTAIVVGNVRYVNSTKNGYMIVIDDEGATEGLVCFSSNDGVASLMEPLEPGNQVIAIGSIMESDDPRNPGHTRRALSAQGVILNPDSSKYVSVSKDLDEVFYD